MQYLLASRSYLLYVPSPISLCVAVTPTPVGGQRHQRHSYDALVDLFASFESFLSRLRIYSEVPPTSALTDVLVKITVELLSTLALATKQVRQGRFSEFVVIGKTLD